MYKPYGLACQCDTHLPASYHDILQGHVVLVLAFLIIPLFIFWVLVGATFGPAPPAGPNLANRLYRKDLRFRWNLLDPRGLSADSMGGDRAT